MSGHSKWAQIKRKKAVTDAQKSRLFSRFSKLIEVAAKNNPDPKTNFALRSAVEQARKANMPAANTERAIKKASTAGSEALENITYEAYGPGGAAVIITAVTSNKNRTVAEIKHLLAQHGGSLSGPGSVMWLFDKKINEGAIEWMPKNTLKLAAVDEAKLNDLLDALEENEDVVEVYANTE